MSDLRKAAQLMLDSVEQMLSGGEWYCARERADDLRAALQDATRRKHLVDPAEYDDAGAAERHNRGLK